MWYEANRDINAGEEITIDGRPKTPFHLNDGFANGGGGIGNAMAAAAAALGQNSSSSIHGDDRSERDNGK